MRVAKRVLLWFVALVALAAVGVIGFLWHDAQDRPDTSGQYVALGSSFASGPGLGGGRAEGSSLVCMRSAVNYPSLLAAKLGLRLVDMSCGGSTTEHILNGGQVFLGPQLDAVGHDARLVTITSGGNDIDFIGSLMNEAGSLGIAGAFVGDPQPVEALDFAGVKERLVTIVGDIRERAPDARIVILSYQAVMPDDGNCAATGLSDASVERARAIALRLDEAQRAAAHQSGVEFIDLHALTLMHSVCAEEPWMLGAAPTNGTAFHPNPAGMEGAAEAIYRALGRSLN